MTKTKTTKRALIASVLSLLVCFTMLIGSTFAWFTDSATTGVNTIQSGNLKIGMYYADGTTNPNSAEWTDAEGASIFNYDLWEPGYTVANHIKISNEGNLALKYLLNFNIEGEIGKLAEVIDVYFVDPAVQVADRSTLASATPIGTLKQVLDGTIPAPTGDLEATKSNIVTIALKMKESADNDYQNQSVGKLTIHLFATQDTVENDSFDNKYDEKAEYFTTAGADDQIGTAGGTLAEDMFFAHAFVDTHGATGEVTVNGGGNTVKFDTEEVNYLTSDNGSKIEMNDVTLTGEMGYLSLGEYKSSTYKNFNAVLNNVTASDLKVGSFNKDKPVAAVVCFGSATVNNSSLTGTSTELTDKIAFDLMGVNYSTVAVNDSSIGKAYVCSNANMTFTNATVDEIITAAHGLNNSGLTIENGSVVNSIKCENYTGSYTLYQGRAKITVKSGATVKTLDLTGVTNESVVTIEDGATVENVTVNGQEVNFAEWKNS